MSYIYPIVYGLCIIFHVVIKMLIFRHLVSLLKKQINRSFFFQNKIPIFAVQKFAILNCI